ncbi:MAG TPA: DUF1330 domain-containing protein [Novosphingobium sp.]|nr:DUF1330 domain-containing protein [Novosphingobium sp.]
MSNGAYWIARVRITDPARYSDYMALAPAAFAKYGGRIMARGAPDLVPEGATPERVALIGFDSMEQALACFHSSEYSAARAKREGAADVEIVIMEAVKP